MDGRKRSRLFSSPTGSTPKQKDKRRYVPKPGEQAKGKKRLPFLDVVSPSSPSRLRFIPASKWTPDEDKSLVEFILLTTLGDGWPQSNDMDYWNSAALFVHQKCSVPIRTCKQTCCVLNLRSTIYYWLNNILECRFL